MSVPTFPPTALAAAPSCSSLVSSVLVAPPTEAKKLMWSCLNPGLSMVSSEIRYMELLAVGLVYNAIAQMWRIKRWLGISASDRFAIDSIKSKASSSSSARVFSRTWRKTSVSWIS